MLRPAPGARASAWAIQLRCSRDANGGDLHLRPPLYTWAGFRDPAPEMGRLRLRRALKGVSGTGACVAARFTLSSVPAGKEEGRGSDKKLAGFGMTHRLHRQNPPLPPTRAKKFIVPTPGHTSCEGEPDWRADLRIRCPKSAAASTWFRSSRRAGGYFKNDLADTVPPCMIPSLTI